MEMHESPDVTCDLFATLVDDLVDGRLDQATRDRANRHLISCVACREMAEDFGSIARSASTLPPHAPRPEVWNRIAQGLKADTGSRAVEPARPGTRVPFWTGWRLAAALATVAVVAIATSVMVVRGPVPAQPSSTAGGTAPVHQSAADTVKDVGEHLRIADEHYQQAITALEKIVVSEQAALDPAVAATLQKNLGIIDQAVRESRAAIASQPNSQLAQTSLFEALRQKVALLEDTIALINVMRRGDQAGAARIIGSLKQS